MRLADTVLRHGHVSEQALVEAILTGDRPRHLDRCELCAERAVVLSRWLDDLRTLGVDMAETPFPPERLKVQHSQILRRLDQLDQKPKVLAFPGLARFGSSAPMGRRVAPAWLGVAAAAGLVLGLVGGQILARMGASPASAATAALDAEDRSPAPPSNVDPLTIDLDGPPAALSEFDTIFPMLASNGTGG